MSNVNKGMLVLPVLLFVAVVLSAAVGYLLLTQKEAVPAPTQETRVLTTKEINQVTAQDTSDELPAIEKDLNGTSFTSIDSDLSSIESELNAALQE